MLRKSKRVKGELENRKEGKGEKEIEEGRIRRREGV